MSSRYGTDEGGGFGGCLGYGIIGVIAVALIGGVVFYNMFFDRVDPGNAGILLNYCTGEQRIITDSSRFRVDPWCDRLAEYPTSENTIEMAGDGNNISCVMKDQQIILMDTATAWAVDPPRVADIYRMRPGVPLVGKDGGDIATQVVRNEIRAGVRDACTQFGWEEAYGARRTEFETMAEKAVQARLDPVGIKVRTVSLRAMDPSPALDQLIAARLEGQKLVESTAFAQRQAENQGARQLAEQKAASALEIQRAQDAAALQKTQAEASIAQAEANARQAKIKADSDAAASLAATTAAAEDIRQKGLAQAEANRAQASSITKEMVELERWRKWNGVLPPAGNTVTTTGPVTVPPGAPVAP